MSNVAAIFTQLGCVLCVCPCCGELFYLSDARLHLPGRRPRSIVDAMEKRAQQLNLAEEAFEETQSEIREEAREHGRKAAKKLLRKIDPIFSGCGYDPQDVKMVCHPVSYAIFCGMSCDKLRRIVLMSRKPSDREAERISHSIECTIKSGNIEFSTLRVGRSGELSLN